MAREYIPVDGDKLVELRNAMNWTAADLAAKSMLALSTVKRAENGERILESSLERLAQTLGVSADGIRREIYEWDVFISHASEDKPKFAESLASRLVQQGLKVWYDARILMVGDSLEEKINEGIPRTEFGVVVLSQTFFEKEWTKKELAILLELRSGKILPVRFGISAEEVRERAPALGDILSADGNSGMEPIVQRIMGALRRPYIPPPLPATVTSHSSTRELLTVNDVAIAGTMSFTIATILGLASAIWIKYWFVRSHEYSSAINVSFWFFFWGLAVGPFICWYLTYILSIGSPDPIGNAFMGASAGLMITPVLTGLFGFVAGSILYLFDWSFTLNRSQQALAAGSIAAILGLVGCPLHVLSLRSRRRVLSRW